MVLLVGVTHADTLEDVAWCAKKAANLRIFEDETGKMNGSLKEVGGSILSISQFTLYGDAKKGNRPSFTAAAKPEQAAALYDAFNDTLRREHGIRVETGVFGADMEVQIQNSGPVTILLDSREC